jgi:outer membrane receptor protein involved in Fe transport
MHTPFRPLALVAALSSAFAPAAWAQSVETVTITATKRTQLLTDVPQTVQAISADKLAMEGAVNFSDVIQLVPGASQTFKASPGFEVLQVRGVSSGAVGDSLVGYYIDEIPFGMPNVQYIPPVNLFDLSRVEVLRGPQGTLYGQGSMGGAIRMITRKPELTTLSGEVRLGYGKVKSELNTSSQKADVMLNVPLSKDVAGVRITAGTSEEDGFIAETGKIKNDNMRVKGLFVVNPDVNVDTTLWSIKSRQKSYSYGQPTKPYLGTIDPTEPAGVDTDVNLGNVTVNWSTPIGDLVSATSYLDHQFNYKFSVRGLLNLFPGAGSWRSDNTVKTQAFTQEFRLSSKPGGSVDWIGGLIYQDSEIKTEQVQGWAAYKAFGLGPTVYTEGDAKLGSKSLGLFGEVSTPMLGGKLVPTLGVRFYKDQRDSSELRDAVASTVQRDYSSVNPRLNLAWKPTKGQLYFVNIAKGFRSGALQGQAAVTAATAAGLPAERLMPQDSLWSYEAGMKMEVAKSLAFEVAAYRIDWKDAQLASLLIGANNVTTSVVSGGNDVQGTGLDFGLTWATPLDGLTMQLAGNVNKTEFTKVPANVKAKVGDQIGGSPKSSGTVALTYRTQIASLGAYANVSYNVRGKQTENNTGLSSDAIRDLRARVGVNGKGWDASIYGLNLNDQRGVAAVLSAIVVNPIQPLKVGMDVNFKF